MSKILYREGTPYFLTMYCQKMNDLYTKIKVDQITEFSNIHTLAFSAKLDALKESYKQDRALLYTALLKVQRTDNARKEK